jgi:hypothetical protein
MEIVKSHVKEMQGLLQNVLWNTVYMVLLREKG